MNPVIRIVDARNHEGKMVTIRGWLHNRRSSKSLHFLTVRDGSGFIQAVVLKDAVANEVFELTDTLDQETSIIMEGTVRSDVRAPGGYEISVHTITVVGESRDYPITPKEHGIDFLLDRRHLWLRTQQQTAIMGVRHEVISAAQNFLDKQGFVLYSAPVLQGTINTSNFGVRPENCFETDPYLSQGGLLYNEAVAMALGRVYNLGPVFSCQETKTRRHLAEFWVVEPEMAYATLDDAVALAVQLVVDVVRKVIDNRTDELRLLGRDIGELTAAVSQSYAHMEYAAAVNWLNRERKEFEYGDTFGGWAQDALSRNFQGLTLITRHPTKVSEMLTKTDPKDPGNALSFELLAPEGYGQIATGGERLDDFELLRQRLEDQDIREPVEWYLDLRRYGSVPHAGFSMHVERLVTWVCGLEHIREAIPFPRMLHRCYP